MRLRTAWLMALLCVPAVATMHAQTGDATASRARAAGKQLRMVVVLSRHGVRSPTWTQERLDSYSAQPWPSWGVPPGNLTARGYELVRDFGGYDRSALAAKGLLAAKGCEDASKTYLWADTDQRTLASGKALAEGLFPGCPPEVHSLAPGANDPLFHSAAKGVEVEEADAAFTELSARLRSQSGPHRVKLLTEMQHVLLGCNPEVACTPVHGPATLLPGGETAAVRGQGDHPVDLQGPLALASSFSEDLLLEYADGMPMSQVGWGNVDEPQLRRFLTLHSDYFDLMHHTPALARLEASNMLSHIASTLQQAVEQKPIEGAIGSPGAKLVVLAGHDTNIASVTALLGLHWRIDGRNDDTPPGTELAFELWQDGRGAYFVQPSIAMQTLHQLRTMPVLTAKHPPAHEVLMIVNCVNTPTGCAWEDFHRIADAASGGRATRTSHSQ